MAEDGPTPPLRIANCSGFYGDRLSAAHEMVNDGPIDVLTGDWLAELTMLILARSRAKDPASGWARTFVTQMEQVMGTCLDQGIRVVSNAGGLDPAGCADAVARVADRLGLSPTIAHVTGDDLTPRLADLHAGGHRFVNLDTGEALGDRIDQVITANAYLGGWGIAEALGAGADIVITGRVTDAAVVVGPAAWHHGWERDDWDELAGAVVAGHVIECGGQATGGNYSFFDEIADLTHVGFPWAEIAADGTCVIGKHDGTGGAVSVGTVTAQLLYEIAGPRYANPDVVARFDTITLEQIAPDRVRIAGTRGEPAPPDLKVAMNYLGGFRNTVTFALTGLDIDAKAAAVDAAFWVQSPIGPDGFAQVRRQLIRTDHGDPPTNEAAVAQYRITVKDADERKVGRAWANAAAEIALCSIPGLFGLGGPPGPGSPYGVYWPTLVPAELVPQYVTIDDRRAIVESGPIAPIASDRADGARVPSDRAWGSTTLMPLGRIVGARSGDKGGNANLGVFARSADAYEWLSGFLTTEHLTELLTDLVDLTIDRFELANLWSLNFVIHGLLDEGVAAATRQDAQAKSLGEYLRARVVPIPSELVADTRSPPR